MTAGQAIAWLDDRQSNVYSTQEKLRWLTQMEEMACFLRRRFGLSASVQELTENSQLMIPSPYNSLYPLWLEAQIHYANGEQRKYNNAMAVVTDWWKDYANMLNREHPKNTRWKFY